MDINKAFTILLGFEGGISNNPNDKGGLTKYGISKASYPDVDIANLTEEKAKDIYTTDYWEAAGCDLVKDELRYALFDTAVNMGVKEAIKLLQQACGAAIDGALGAETLGKSNTITIADYLLCRLLRYNAIMDANTSQIVFRKGWTSRVAAIYNMQKQGQV